MSDRKRNLEECLDNHGLKLTKGSIISWKSDSEGHPQNWSPWPKCYTVIIVVWLEFYMTALSSSGAAAAKAAVETYNISQELSVFAFISVYLLGQTAGGIFCSPISEFFGRRTIYIIASGVFAISSAIIGVPNHVAAVFIGRFVQGVAAAVPAIVAFGNFSDLFDAEMRIWVVYAYTLFGMCGLAIGPIYASYVVLMLGWRWIFHISAIVSGISALACFAIKESNAEQILIKKTDEVKFETQNHKLEADVERSDNPVQDFFSTNIYRPLTFCVTEPLVILCAILCAIAFGLIYGLTESLTIVYTTPPFDSTFDETSSSLSFLAILIGYIINIIPRFYDRWYLQRQRKTNKHILPETKIHSFAIACPTLAIGLWIFAWTIPQKTENAPWPISMIGLVCVGFSANDFSYVLFGYITDSYGFQAASAVAVLSSARTLAAAAFPLFATQMYEGLGNNIATTILAAVATVFCFTPWLFLQYGAKLRTRSKWAASGNNVLKDENKHMREKIEENGRYEDEDEQIELRSSGDGSRSPFSL